MSSEPQIPNDSTILNEGLLENKDKAHSIKKKSGSSKKGKSHSQKNLKYIIILYK